MRNLEVAEPTLISRAIWARGGIMLAVAQAATTVLRLREKVSTYNSVTSLAVELKNGKIVDAVSESLGIIVELKPSGKRKWDYCQLNGYLKQLRKQDPSIDWKGILIRYKP